MRCIVSFDFALHSPKAMQPEDTRRMLERSLNLAILHLLATIHAR